MSYMALSLDAIVVWHQVATARESVSKGQLRNGPGTFDRDLGLACYRKRVTDRSPDSKLGGDNYLLCACAVVCAVILGELGACACACAGAVRAVRAGSCAFFRNPRVGKPLMLLFRVALLRQEELRSHLHNVAIAGRAISWKRLECFVSSLAFVFPWRKQVL